MNLSSVVSIETEMTGGLTDLLLRKLVLELEVLHFESPPHYYLIGFTSKALLKRMNRSTCYLRVVFSFQPFITLSTCWVKIIDSSCLFFQTREGWRAVTEKKTRLHIHWIQTRLAASIYTFSCVIITPSPLSLHPPPLHSCLLLFSLDSLECQACILIITSSLRSVCHSCFHSNSFFISSCSANVSRGTSLLILASSPVSTPHVALQHQWSRC